jgi:hypothetical protein
LNPSHGNAATAASVLSGITSTFGLSSRQGSFESSHPTPSAALRPRKSAPEK